DDRERHQPGELLRIHQEGDADPIKSGEEIAEAEPPSGSRGDADAADAPRGGAIEQPHDDRHGQKHHRPEVERSERQRRNRAGRKGDGYPPPSPGEHDRMDELDEGTVLHDVPLSEGGGSGFTRAPVSVAGAGLATASPSGFSSRRRW